MNTTTSALKAETPGEAAVGSPLKKARPSIDQGTGGEKFSATQSLSAALGSVMAGATPGSSGTESTPKVEEEEL